MHPLESAHPLIVYVDVKSPYAYLAVEPTQQLAAELNLEIDWRPLTLNIGSYLGTAKTNKTGKVVRQNRSKNQWQAVRYSYNDAKRYARMRGVTLYGTQKIWDSAFAGIGLLWSKRFGMGATHRYLNAVYEPFWRRELDIEDASVVEQTLAIADVPTDGFADYLQGEGREAHDSLQAQLHPAGVYGVPTYVVEGEVFFGREHLPVVRWLLSGRRGPVPPVAYESGAAS